MRTSSNWLILLLISFILYSCQTKSGKIEELRDLRTEVRVNGESFDEEDWEKFELELAKINEDLEVYDLTLKETELVEKLNMEILEYKMKYNLGSAVGDLVNSVTQAIDDATGLNTSAFAKSITETTSSTQRQLEKKAKRVLWIRIAWIAGGIVLTGIISLIIVLLNTGRTRRSRQSRSTRRNLHR